MRDDLERVLVCAECGKESEGGARCWRPLLTVDDELATYCPDCAREDFGDARLRAARRLRQPRDPPSPQACRARAAVPVERLVAAAERGSVNPATDLIWEDEVVRPGKQVAI
jgi:hypothetical protein